jgi:hypothetical protein
MAAALQDIRRLQSIRRTMYEPVSQWKNKFANLKVLANRT